jgi:uncharacterized OB-fold protein
MRGARTGEFLLPRCERCGAWGWPPPEICNHCASSSWRWAPASARGTVLSVVRIWRGAGELFQGDVPYDLVLVELAEGPEFVTRAASEGLAPGMIVKLAWREVGGKPWPCAVPANASGGA